MAADLVAGSSKVPSQSPVQKAAQAAATAAKLAAAQAAPKPKAPVPPPQHQTAYEPPRAQPVALTVPDKASAANESVPASSGAVPTHLPKTPYDMDKLALANTQYGYFNQMAGGDKGSPGNPGVASELALGFLRGQSGDWTYQSVFIGNLAANGQAEAVLGQAWKDPANQNLVLQGVNASREATQGGATGITDDQIKGWATGTGPYATQWAQIARELSPPVSVYSRSEQKQASTKVSNAQSAYVNAQRQTKELDDTLNQELARIGPGLTDEQRKAYIEAYKHDHGTEYAAEATAAGALETALEDPAFQSAAQSDPTAAKKQVEGYQALADSPSQGKAALQWAGQAAQLLHDHPDSPQARALVAGFGVGTPQEALTRIGTDLVQPAMASTYSELAVETDPDQAFEQLKALVEPFQNIREICKTPNEITEAFATGQKLAQAAAKGTLTQAQLAELGASYEKMSPVARGFATASVAYGAFSAAKAGTEGEYGEMVKGALSTTESGLKLAAGATEVLAESGKLAQLLGAEGARGAAELAGFAARLAPALGAMVSGLSFVQDLQGAAKDRSAGLVVAAVGDAIGMLGVIPGGGEVFAAIGTGVSAIGHLIDFQQQQGAQSDEEKKLLAQLAQDPTLKLDPRLAEIYSGGDVRTGTLGEIGLTPEQIQAYALKNPDLMDDGSTGILVNAAQQLGIGDPGDFLTFLDRVAAETPYQGKPSLRSAVGNLNNLWIDTNTGPADPVTHPQHFRQVFATRYPNTQQFVSGIQNADPKRDH